MRKLIKYARPYYLHILAAALSSVGCSCASVWVIGIGLLSNFMVVSTTGYLGAELIKKMKRDAVAINVRTQ